MVEKRLYEPVLRGNVILELQQFTGVVLHRVSFCADRHETQLSSN